MISASLSGGLGNQMFQIACALSYGLDNDFDVAFDLQAHKIGLQGFNAIKYKDNIYHNLKTAVNPVFKNKYDEPFFHYHPIPVVDDLILYGYFQSPKYFIHNQDYIRKIFKAPELLENKLINWLKSLNIQKSLLSLHIRMGDYLRFPDHHPFIGMNYIVKALSHFDLSKYTVLVFSDDINWCKANLNIEDVIYVSGFEDYEQLYLMSYCDDHIISNSTFSWCGSFLNDKNKTVILPSTWFGKALNHDTSGFYLENYISF
jgi:hypothetical protein